MTVPRLIRFAELAPSRWANGTGETVEIARVPASDPFEWRLSIATISEASTFSPLPGISRVLMALTPGPLVLTIDGVEVSLARHESGSFSGDQDVAALHPASAQRDLNLMARAGVPTLEPRVVDGDITVPANAIALITLDGDLAYRGAPLRPGDTLITHGDTATLEGHGTVAIARIRNRD